MEPARQIFANVSDLHAEIVRSAVADDVAWTEWEMKGTRRDGTTHEMRGVVVFGVRDPDSTNYWYRFYRVLGPVPDMPPKISVLGFTNGATILWIEMVR